MACGEYPAEPIRYFLEWQFVDGAVCYFGEQIGVAAFMLMVFGATFLGLYQSTGSVMLPLVALVVLAPMVMFIIPAVGVQFVGIILAIMIMGGGLWVIISLDI